MEEIGTSAFGDLEGCPNTFNNVAYVELNEIKVVWIKLVVRINNRI